MIVRVKGGEDTHVADSTSSAYLVVLWRVNDRSPHTSAFNITSLTSLNVSSGVIMTIFRALSFLDIRHLALNLLNVKDQVIVSIIKLALRFFPP